MDGGKKQGRDDRKASSQVRSDRKSGGDAKKGGRGGKFTWEGADGYTDEDLDLVATKAAGACSSGKNKS